METKDMNTPEQEPSIVADTPPVAFRVPEVTFEFLGKYYR